MTASEQIPVRRQTADIDDCLKLLNQRPGMAPAVFTLLRHLDARVYLARTPEGQTAHEIIAELDFALAASERRARNSIADMRKLNTERTALMELLDRLADKVAAFSVASGVSDKEIRSRIIRYKRRDQQPEPVQPDALAELA